jgi:sterol desaturase/sphingolipid hydroxylase (fatty acid hydroxylase superfamily)
MMHFQLRIYTGSVAADAALAFLVFTFCDYWNHRLQHTSPLWPLHRVHHAAEEMTVLTLWRQHPSISAVEPFFKLWPLALFDVSGQCVAIAGMVIVAYEHLIHSNLRWNWGWFGRWVLIPPTGHRLHHYIDPACQMKNLGIPVLWDRLFGTWDGGPPPGEQLGIADVAYNTGHPFREAWRDLVEFLTGLRPWARELVRRSGW